MNARPDPSGPDEQTRAGAAPLRFVQVGSGAMGRAWLENLARSPDATLVGLVDLDADVARSAAEASGHSGAVVGVTLDEVLAQVAADAVLNVTTPAAHHGVNVAALRHGLPVLCEKPLADTVAVGLASVAAAERAGRLLMVSQSRRYFRHLETFRAQIARLGTVGTVRCTFAKAPHFGGFRDEMDFPLLLDMAVHQLDLARALVGAEPVAVYCESYNPAWSWYRGDAAAEVVVEFGGGARFGFSGSWCAPGRETSWNGEWRVSAARGSATWDGDHAPVAEDDQGRPVTAEPGTGPEEIAGSLAEFVDAVRTGSRPAGEARTNLLSLAMVEAAIRSATEHRRVTIAEVLEQAYALALQQQTDPDLLAVLTAWPSVHAVIGAGGSDGKPS